MLSSIKQLFKMREGQNLVEESFVRFTYLFLFILVLALISVVADSYRPFMTVFPFIVVVGVAYITTFILRNIQSFNLRNLRVDILIITFILLFSVWNGRYFSERILDGAHDPGVYFETAIQLAKTGTYYQDYSRKPIILSLVAFTPRENNKTRSDFLEGIPTYFSLFFHYFGFPGFSVGLSLAQFISTSTLYFLCRLLRGWKAGFVFILLFLFNYYTLYFSRGMWSENLQLLLIWFYVYLFYRGWRQRSLTLLVAAALPVSTLMFYRLEAFLYLGIYFFVAPLSIFLLRKELLFKKAIIIFAVVRTVAEPRPDFAWKPRNQVKYNQQVFIFVFLFYIFGPAFILWGILGLANIILEKPKIKEAFFIITLITLPQFIFLIRPSAQIYLNWVARRYWGVFFPYIFILFALFLTNKQGLLGRMSRRSFSLILVIVFLVSNLPGMALLNHVDGKGILNFEKEVSAQFTSGDLVIFWDRYGFEDWGPPLFFLYDTNVVYDRIPAFDKQIYAMFMKDYQNVYIATSVEPPDNIGGYFNEHVTFVKTITSPNFQVLRDSSCHLVRFAVEPDTFLGYYQIAELCAGNNPETRLSNYKIRLNIYKVDNNFKDEFIDTYFDKDYRITSKTRYLFPGGVD